MRDTIETLQTLVLLLTVLLQVITALGFVYSFNLLIKALKQLATTVSEPTKVVIQTHEHVETPVPPPPQHAPPPQANSAPLPVFKCARCDARLPATPLASRGDGDVVILIYKCGRCGKHSGVNPITGDVKEVVAPT